MGTDKSAIFIDAGFLLAIGGQRTVGTSLRSAVTVDYRQLIEGLFKACDALRGLDPLRMYWYDAARDGLPTYDHKTIAGTSGVKLRLGRISVNGDQKGVDLKLGLDLVGLARNRAVSVAFLMSGDDDLGEAVEQAQDLGMQVVLLALPKKENRLGVDSVAEDLALRVDSIELLDESLLSGAFKRTQGVPRQPPAPQAPKPAPPTTTLTRVLPRPVPSAQPASSTQPAPSAQPEIIHTSDSTQAHWPGILQIAVDVGTRVAENWLATATQGDLNHLREERPLLPLEVDRVLIKDCASRIGEPKTDIQDVRKALRASFWEHLDELN